jgi:3'-5' exoribonuclease
MTEKPTYFYQFIQIDYTVTDLERDEILHRYPAPELPHGTEFFSLDELAKGDPVSARLLLNEAAVQTTKTNKQFLKMTFSNNKGTVQAKMWDNQGDVERNLPILEAYSVFDMEGVVDEFRGFKSVTVYRLEPSEESVNPFAYLPYTKQNLEELTVELFAYLYELKPAYKQLALRAMDEFWPAFATSPAAKGFHHNYLGGLLKHTVGLMRFARYIIKQEGDPFQAVMKLIQIVEKAHKQEIWDNFTSDADAPKGKLVWKDTIDHLYHMLGGMMEYKEDELHADAVIISILFHDIGKILEYDFAGKSHDPFHFLYPNADRSELEARKQTGITMDPLGVQIGHIPYGVLILTKLVELEEAVLSLEEIHLISHCILCHHGLPEWGSPVRPQTIEGYIIHIADYLDSRYENTEVIK